MLKYVWYVLFDVVWKHRTNGVFYNTYACMCYSSRSALFGQCISHSNCVVLYSLYLSVNMAKTLELISKIVFFVAFR